ncbi:MAG TPA: phosphotransferase [Candidatus Binatia bacterium]|nr:phosphotransferase [Candidatus Binatia bacterium]
MSRQLEDLIGVKLRAIFGQKTVIGSLIALAGDASSRRYYRAELRGQITPSSVVVMELPSGSVLPLSSEELAVFKEPLKELPFLNMHRFLSRIGVRVPRLYGQSIQEGLLFLEDLGDVALWDKVQGLPPSAVLDWYQKAIDELLLLQTRGTRERDDSCIAFQQRFDFRLYMWEFDHFLEYGLEKRAETAIPQTQLQELRNTFVAIAKRLDGLTPCLNHRDYHSWNLMIHDDAVAMIDFQDALLAPPQYDLASLLNDRITDSIIELGLEEKLLGYYVDRRTDMEKQPIRRDEFIETYLLSAIQRDLKVVGRFHYLDVVKGKTAYKKFIPPTVRRLKRNFARLPQTERLIPILAEHYEEMR